MYGREINVGYEVGYVLSRHCLLVSTTLPRSLQDSDIKNHGRIRPENGTRFIPDIIMYGSCNILTWLSHGTHNPDMIKLWCTQDPYKDQYARFLHG